MRFYTTHATTTIVIVDDQSCVQLYKSSLTSTKCTAHNDGDLNLQDDDDDNA